MTDSPRGGRPTKLWKEEREGRGKVRRRERDTSHEAKNFSIFLSLTFRSSSPCCLSLYTASVILGGAPTIIEGEVQYTRVTTNKRGCEREETSTME
jgi:hypothetical protein